MSNYQQRPQYLSKDESHGHHAEPHADSSPPASSGAVTPTTTGSPSSSFLSSSVGNLWGGLIRRFSSDAAASLSTTPSSLHHQPADSSHALDDAHHHGGLVPRGVSPLRPPPLEPLVLGGFKDETAADARLLNTAIAEEIRLMVPARLAIVDEWNLVYSLYQDGASLATLYKKCAAFEGKRVGFVLVVKDLDAGVFGAYLSDFPHPAPKYFGTGECFLWRASVLASLPPPPSADTTNMTRTATIAPPPTPTTRDHHSHNLLDPLSSSVPAPAPSIRFKAFPYSGVNEYYMLCEAHFLSVGAGDGRYGLWLDDSLARGVSSTCQTFGNEPLSDEGEEFGVLGAEVWVVGNPAL